MPGWTPGRIARSVERGAWGIGLVALSVWGVVTASGALAARHDIQQFASVSRASRMVAAEPDTTDWSDKRLREWRDSLTRQTPPPQAIFRMPRLKIEVPVLEGTDDWTLNRAVGRIEGTAAIGTTGNIGIAGHRDGFFRPLKDVVTGDVMEIETLDRVERYRVEHIWIVKPEDVWVIDPTDAPSVTLVTCYPFYFIGSAPQRLIVRAVREEMAAKQPLPS